MCSLDDAIQQVPNPAACTARIRWSRAIDKSVMCVLRVSARDAHIKGLRDGLLAAAASLSLVCSYLTTMVFNDWELHAESASRVVVRTSFRRLSGASAALNLLRFLLVLMTSIKSMRSLAVVSGW